MKSSAKRAQSLLVHVDEIDNFIAVRDIRPESISPEVLDAVKRLDEREELEPYLRNILFDPNETPHGPAEIVDVLTHKLSIRGVGGMAAFIIKGKSFATVRPSHVSHQIYRLEKISELSAAVFAATGTILDGAKEQFTSTAKRLNCNYAILDCVDLARVLVAYGFVCPRDGRRIAAGRCRCGYSPTRRIANPLQQQALKELERSHRRGQRAALVVLPPGSGKTRIAAEDASRRGARRLLYVAHTYEILDVAKSEFEAVFGADNVTLHTTAGSIAKLNQVNLAIVQLLSRHLQDVRTGNFDYVVIDEFHHAAAPSYRKVIDATGGSFRLGLTATPFRGDQQDIAELCDRNVVVNYDLRSAIDYGILSPYRYFGCFDSVDYSQVRRVSGRYDVRDLEKALITPERDVAIRRKWHELADGKASIAFCCSQAHAERVAGYFNDSGVPAATYLAETTSERRRELVDELANGEKLVLCVVDVLNEGADFPFIECLLLLRPTDSQRVFYQQLGRGLRRYPGKPHCTIIDFIGNFKNAYKIVEYQGLLPQEEDLIGFRLSVVKSRKDVLNLPLGCEVHFEDDVIDIFARQTLDPGCATRHNIGRILIYQYERLSSRLGRVATQADVNRNLLLGVRFYRDVFGSWKKFQKVLSPMQ
jgi:superfamily II DNA or RNA helicase